MLKKGVSDLDFSQSFSFLDSVAFVCKNDPGLFDSLAVSMRTSNENLSGVYENIDLSFLPDFLSKAVVDLENNSFSASFVEESAAFLFYKYFHVEEEESDLKNSWFLIENLALQRKKQKTYPKQLISKQIMV